MKLSIRVEPPLVRIGRRTFGAQWVDFYLLLALGREGTSSPETTVEALSRVGAWQHKKPGSVGKEVARHMQQLERAGLEGVIQSTAKTQCWRLAVPPPEVEILPDERTATEWLASRTMAADDDAAWSTELERLLRALVLVQKGDARGAQAALDEAEARAADVGLLALRTLVEGRMAYLLLEEEDEQEERLFQLTETWSRRPDAASRAVTARLRSFQAMKDRFADPSSTRAALTKMISDLEHRGDIGSLSVLLNVLALLERRCGDERAAVAHLSRAASLLAINGDFHLLQAVLYNLALCRRTLLERQGQPADDVTFRLLDACLFMCANARAGNDSALAETSGAEWSLERGDVRGAQRYLAAAERLLSSIDASFDQAYFLEVRARVANETGDPRGDPARDLRAALRFYEGLGDTTALARVKGLLRPLESAGGQRR